MRGVAAVGEVGQWVGSEHRADTVGNLFCNWGWGQASLLS